MESHLTWVIGCVNLNSASTFLSASHVFSSVNIHISSAVKGSKVKFVEKLTKFCFLIAN